MRNMGQARGKSTSRRRSNGGGGPRRRGPLPYNRISGSSASTRHNQRKRRRRACNVRRRNRAARGIRATRRPQQNFRARIREWRAPGARRAVRLVISPARKIAYEVLRRVEVEGAYASDLLHSELGARVKPEDAGLATELVMGVLRSRRLLDFLLERQLKKPVARLDLQVALALRIGLYQLRFLERGPARAAVNESVELVKSARKTSAATLVNAVLRRAANDARVPPEKLVPQATLAAERLGILHSHPTWIVERWLARLGEQQTIALLEANNRTPRLTCALHDLKQREEIFAALQRSALRVDPGKILQSAFAASGGSPTRTESFRTGAISIQDEASQTVPLLLDVQTNDRVLDLCAAPGGKTPPLVRAAGPSGTVVAADRYAHRLRAMREQFQRLDLTQVRLVELDAASPLPFSTLFHRILLDAPCSGTGTLARHRAIRWRLHTP